MVFTPPMEYWPDSYLTPNERKKRAEEEAARRDEEWQETQREEREAEAHRWHASVTDGFRSGLVVSVLELKPPRQGIGVPVGTTATCELRQSAHVYRSKESATLEHGRFAFVYPNDFASVGPFPPPSWDDHPKGIAPRFHAVWRSEVLDEPFEHSFLLDRWGRPHDIS
jgi:hypothetical protein